MNDGSVQGLTPWRVQLFGSFAVERDGKAASFRTKKTASLFAYLAFYAGKRIRKDQLIDALWPDADSDKGRHSLRVALSSLRESFGAPGWDPADYLLSDRDTVGIAPEGFEIDVHRFRTCLAESRKGVKARALLTEAVEAYAGLFLPGFAEDWILPQALELEESFAQAVCDLVDLTAQSGELRKAVSIGRKALGICPNREDLHIALMRAYATSGQPAQAIKQFEELERMLDATWGEMPSDEAVAVLDSLPKRSAPARPSVAAMTSDRDATRTAFVGRDAEIADLCERLRATNNALITLLGLGGTGKTRLAQKVGEELEGDLGGRVWFVSLVGVDRQEQVYEEVLSAVRPVEPDADLLASLVRGIGRDPALLILDNLELLVRIAQTLIRALRKGCPALRILTTSRIPLEIEGEELTPLAPLGLPADYRDLAALRQAPSVRLLVAAGQSARPGFAVTPANAQSVLLLCQKLEGIPLALELAAAKLGTLSPAQVLGSMGRRIDLSSSKAEVREEHRSLRAIIEWSLGLLGGSEGRSFARLGVCRGGFNHALATALLGEAADEHVRRLGRLALLSWIETADEVRFEMLETVREIAFSRLEDDPDELASAVESHFDYVKSLTTGVLRQADPGSWAQMMQGDNGNIHAAIEWATLGKIDPISAWQAFIPLEHYIDRTGRPQAWIAPLEALLQATSSALPPAVLARAHALLAFVHYGRRNIPETVEHYTKAIGAADQTEETLLRVELRSDSISASITLGAFDRAQKALEEAIALLGSQDESTAAANCHLNLAWVLFDRGREEESEPIFARAFELAEKTGDAIVIAGALTGLACAVGHTRLDEAQPIFDRAIEMWRREGLPARLAHAFYYRGLIDYRHGRLDDSLRHIEKAFRLFIENGIALGQSSVSICGTTLAALDRYDDAALFWGRAEAIRRRQGMLPMPTLQQDVEREGQRVRDMITPAFYATAIERAEGMSDRELVDSVFGPAR